MRQPSAIPTSSPSGASADDWLAGIAASVGSALLYAGFTLVSPTLSRRWGPGVAATALTLSATAALALLAFNWGAARLSPTALTVATLVEPLTAVLLASALLGERLRLAQWLGAVLLMGGIWGLGRGLPAESGKPEGPVR